MIIVTERKLNYKSSLKDPKDVAKFFDLMDKAFFDIETALIDLSISFLNKNWHLKESLSDTLAAYHKAAEKIRARLTELAMMNSTLRRFLLSETRPIPIKQNAADYIDDSTDVINKSLKRYYKDVKGTLFPDFDAEIKMHKEIIESINSNIDRINEINSAYRIRAISHIKNLSV
jgi:hypothetical protein